MENFMLHPVGNTILLILYIVHFIAGILLLIKAIKMPNSTQQQLSDSESKDSPSKSPEGSPKCLNKNCTYCNEMFDMNCDANEELCEKCLGTSDNGKRCLQFQREG